MNAERYRIADAILRSPQIDQRFMTSIAGPALVMSAFASELYLKCLIVLEGRHYNVVHSLQQLFGLLHPDTQKSINARWDAYVAQPMRTRIYEMIEHHFPDKIIRRDLAWTLRKGAEGFQKLRYLHEESVTENSAFFLGEFPTLLRDEILQRRPEWSHYAHAAADPLAGNIHENPGTPFRY